MRNEIMIGTIIAIFLLGLTVIGPIGAGASLEPTLVASWHMDEGSGGIICDETINYNNGTIYGATWTVGLCGQALEFDGKDDYVEIPDDDSLDLEGPFTLESWVKPYNKTLEPTEHIAMDILEKRTGLGAADSNYEFHLHTGAKIEPKHLVCIIGNGTHFSSVRSDPIEVAKYQWSHVACVYNGTSLNLYLNGSLIKSGKGIKNRKGDLVDPNGIVTPKGNTANLTIGAFNRDGVQHVEFFNGTIDEISIYNYALTGDEIKACYNSGLACQLINQQPVADANGPYVSNEGSPITFDTRGSSDPDGDELQYRWDFNNDGTWDTGWSSSPTAIYMWNDDWSGTAKVEVSDGELTDEDTTSVTVFNVAPTVDAGMDQTVDEGDTVGFSGSFSDPGSDDTHTITWDFGDGGSDSGTLAPSHVYGDNGLYTVTLTVTDDDGGKSSDTLTVTVNNVAPTASIESIGPLNPGFILPVVHNLTFNGSFTDPGWLDTHTTTWDFGDGTGIAGTLTEENNKPDATGTTTAQHTYSEPGTYIVTVTVTDDDANFGVATATVTVMTAEEAKEFTNSSIQNLPDDAFKKPAAQRKNAFANKFIATDEMISACDYQEAIDKLRNDIRAKADGSVDGNPNNDWITDPEAQEEICKMIDDLIAYLETLL